MDEEDVFLSCIIVVVLGIILIVLYAYVREYLFLFLFSIPYIFLEFRILKNYLYDNKAERKNKLLIIIILAIYHIIGVFFQVFALIYYGFIWIYLHNKKFRFRYIKKYKEKLYKVLESIFILLIFDFSLNIIVFSRYFEKIGCMARHTTSYCNAYISVSWTTFSSGLFLLIFLGIIIFYYHGKEISPIIDLKKYIKEKTTRKCIICYTETKELTHCGVKAPKLRNYKEFRNKTMHKCILCGEETIDTYHCGHLTYNLNVYDTQKRLYDRKKRKKEEEEKIQRYLNDLDQMKSELETEADYENASNYLVYLNKKNKYWRNSDIDKTLILISYAQQGDPERANEYLDFNAIKNILNPNSGFSLTEKILLTEALTDIKEKKLRKGSEKRRLIDLIEILEKILKSDPSF